MTPAARGAGVTARAEWLQRRRRGVGSSDVPGVLGLSPWASPYSVWAGKVFDLPDDDRGDDDREFGRRAERMILEWFEDETGLTVRDQQVEVAHPDHSHFLATLDGRAYEGPNGTDPVAVVEAKSTRDSPDEWAEQIPMQYRVQTIWQLAVTGLPVAYVPALHRFSGQFRLYEVPADPADIAYVLGEVGAWWDRYVVTGDPPPVDEHRATTETIRQVWPTGDGSVEADEAARELVARLNAYKEMLALTKGNVTRMENELRQLLGDREALVDGVDARGRPIVLASWREQPDARFDVDAFRARYPRVAERFTNRGTHRVLRATKPKKEKPSS